MAYLHEDLTSQIIHSFYHVYNQLGYGFLEKVYQNALYLELKKRGFTVEAQKQIKVFYDGTVVGEYYADMIVNEKVILELKAAEHLIPEFEMQLINYLKSTEAEVGLLLNFGKQPKIIRKIFSNSRKSLS